MTQNNLRNIISRAARTVITNEEADISDDNSRYTNTVTEETDIPETMEEPVVNDPEGYSPIIRDDMHVETARFSSASWFEKIGEQSIVIGGQGGISSWFTFLVAKMFPRSIFTYDFDRVERVNLAGQLFSVNDVGSYKGEALVRTIWNYCDYRSVYSVTEAFTVMSSPARIMACGFDNMEARRIFYTSWKSFVAGLPNEEDKKTCLFIDGRLAAESLQIFAIVGDAQWDMEKYEREYLFDDSQADETVCSYKQTAFVANIIAGMMANILVNHCANLCGGCRTIPFYTQYEADQMYLKLEGGV